MPSESPAKSTPNPIPQAPSPSETEMVKKPGANAFTSKYQIIREIGHGAQGRIYTARRLADDITVVVKQLNINSIKTWKEYELFHREAKVLEELNIPGVAKFYEGIECLDDDPPCSYIVQEYIDGVSLQQLLNDAHRFSVDNVYEILIQTLQILYKLHHHYPTIIHRDIKPSNLMLTRDQNGTFKITLIDFGAVANPQIQGGGSTVAGTLGYMPPEQLTGKPVPASDIYAVGALAVQLFSGKSPADIPVKDFRLIFEPEMENRPHKLITLLRQMLEPDPSKRLSDIPEIIEQLKSFKAGDFDRAQFKTSSDQKDYSNDYDEKLAEVASICEPGNIELWQQLPDNEIRKVPGIFKTIYDTKRKRIKAQKDHSTKHKLSDEAKILLGCLSFLIISIVLVWLGIAFKFNILLTVFVAFFLGIFAYYLITKPSKIKTPPVLESTKNINQAIKLIGNSRKTIATITKIAYQPIPEKCVEVRKASGNALSHMVSGFPRFKVFYKFNPPDDKRSEDIVHEYYTHVEHQNHYRIGDQIPILYHIEDKIFSDEVTSMPFPLPLSDFDEDVNNTIVDRSNGFDNETYRRKHKSR
ncbi:MAG: serine/threonine protein kinase [Proteobacteria bacterium]|nr:serine/threonine protein kinase [Pseudomonadota bacterium]